MESGLADIKYPLPSYLRRRQQDIQTYNQESDCPLHYRRHHSQGEQKQKHYTRIPRHICRRSSHTDILGPTHQRPHHDHNHLQNQQHQQNNSHSIPSTTTTTNNNINGNHRRESISSHSIKYLEQTRQQSVTTIRRSETQASTLQNTLIRVGRSGLEHWIPGQCRVEIDPDCREKVIYQESPLYLTQPRLTLIRLRRQYSDPGTHSQQQQKQQQHKIYSYNDNPVYLRLVPRRRSDGKSNLCTQKQSKLKDKNFTLGACPLKWQSQSLCDCPRGGLNDPQGLNFPGQINLEKTQENVTRTIGVNDEDKETLDQDFVMGENKTALLPGRKIHDQIVSRQGHSGRKHPIIENRCREIRTVELAVSAHQLSENKVTDEFQNTNDNSNACRKGLENYNCCKMSSINRGDFIKELKSNYQQTVPNINRKNLAGFQRNRSQCKEDETQNQEDPGIDIITNIRDNHKLNITTISKVRKNINPASETRKNTVYKTESNLCANNLGWLVTGFNITCLRVFLFIFIGCAIQGTLPGGVGDYRVSWLFPGADAKAVLSLSKNVLMTDADHKQVSYIGKIDPPSESTQEERSFNDFPDVDPERSVAGDSTSNEPGVRRDAGDSSKENTDRNNNDPEPSNKNMDEYEAYDDSTGQDYEDTTDASVKKKTPQKLNPDQNIDDKNEASDVSDEEIADSIDEEEDDEDDDDDDDEDWAGDMSSQPLFVPPGMNIDSSQGSVGDTGKYSSESDTSTKSEDETLKREIPEYMLKLYQKFTQKHYIHPASDTVRSFSNINDGRWRCIFFYRNS